VGRAGEKRRPIGFLIVGGQSTNLGKTLTQSLEIEVPVKPKLETQTIARGLGSSNRKEWQRGTQGFLSKESSRFY
jgi:hypothetical protein